MGVTGIYNNVDCLMVIGLESWKGNTRNKRN